MTRSASSFPIMAANAVRVRAHSVTLPVHGALHCDDASEDSSREGGQQCRVEPGTRSSYRRSRSVHHWDSTRLGSAFLLEPLPSRRRSKERGEVVAMTECSDMPPCLPSVLPSMPGPGHLAAVQPPVHNQQA
ncbi:hypothetical protein DAEQUDRAFT_169979 [Daedalea quercina L-15889]|uniref:Uncharacterized protein n=1 Tax=Daedalea quercina L-15889 TaxID=1314783 RepID=A0A165RK18_9APHY|nr:hypothetical protein DAEQUDRAFT_169979 [Daedalea quercina L-15889]